MQDEKEILENARLCAKEGWKGNYLFKSGEVFEGGLITATDFEKGAVVLERIGERHLQPRLVFLKDLRALQPDWS